VPDQKGSRSPVTKGSVSDEVRPLSKVDKNTELKDRRVAEGRGSSKSLRRGVFVLGTAASPGKTDQHKSTKDTHSRHRNVSAINGEKRT